VLRVLEKATQNRPEARYQTVEEFWDEIADASLPPTRPLQMVQAAACRRCDASRARIFQSNLKKSSLKRRRRGRTSKCPEARC
jgi:hypothetical protein